MGELERGESVPFSRARSIEGKGPYTYGHCERLEEYSARLGEQLELPEESNYHAASCRNRARLERIAVPNAIRLEAGRSTPTNGQSSASIPWWASASVRR